MTPHRLFAAVLTGAGAALAAAAIGVAPSALAEPADDTSPPCVEEGTCTTLVPKAVLKQPLTPASAESAAPDPQ